MAIGFLAVLAGAAALNGALPPDVDPRSRSRLPPIERSTLDAEGQRIYDVIRGANPTIPLSGPAPNSMVSPKLAEPMHVLNQYLRTTVAGRAYFELAALIGAREYDQQYEWSAHEPAGVQAGLSQASIDAVKFNRDVAGLPEKDATLIRFGRALLHDHKVSPELWAKMVELFGKQGTMELTVTIGDYILAGLVLTATDQHQAEGAKALLPIPAPAAR